MSPTPTQPTVPSPGTGPDLTTLRLQFRPRVIVKYRDDVEFSPIPIGPQGTLDVPGWSTWSAAFPGLTNRGLFQQGADALEDFLGQAQQSDPTYVRVELDHYVALNVPPSIPATQVLHLVLNEPAVERAYIEPPPVPPPSTIYDPQLAQQTHLKSAIEGGIDALFVKGLPGADGGRASLVDIEWGWTLDHEDLAAHAIPAPIGINNSEFGHGTSVLGTIAAVEGNVYGGVGITPAPASIRCVSPFRTDTSGTNVYSVAEAILDAVEIMSTGHVLLLEVQTDLFGFSEVPVELEPAVFDAIRLATALGITVIEAAGNGTKDFDTEVTDDLGRFVLNPSSIDFLDSGAILVAQAKAGYPHVPFTDKARGDRIDCYALGEKIVTLDSNWARSRNMYTTTFGGTSGAAAIVAGAALCVQSMKIAADGQPFGAWQMREILSDPSRGTASNSSTDRIGVMPDLRKHVEFGALALVPDIYVRDHVGDDGDPHDDWVSSSPDIFVLPGTGSANPQGDFGEGSGREDEMLGSEVFAGQDHSVYVRVRNRGGHDAADVEAVVYWAEPAALLDPTKLQLIGKTKIANVPADDRLVVSDAIAWPAAQVPGSGHYCFLAFVGHATDPAPSPAKFTDWVQYKHFVGRNNNVAWRNFNVVSMEPAMSTRNMYLALPFHLVGAWDMERAMSVEIGGRIPRSASLQLELPAGYDETLRLRNRARPSLPELRPVPTPWRNAITFPEVKLPKGIRIPLRLLVHVPPQSRHRTYEVYVRQLHEGREMGRISWRLKPGP